MNLHVMVTPQKMEWIENFQFQSLKQSSRR